jgi:NTP pyrophosphatase (non-canonical NTP hydrolase)
MAIPEPVGIREFQHHTRLTDTTRQGVDRPMLPFLGLCGEVGSLLSELKKKQRDTDSYTAYAGSVVEELGDVLWYLANIVDRCGLDLRSLAQNVAVRRSAPLPISEVVTFQDLQTQQTLVGPTSSDALERRLALLAIKVGRLLDALIQSDTYSDGLLFAPHLEEILAALLDAADAGVVSLDIAASRNTEKTLGRWPATILYPPLFDANDDPDEQLPRRIVMHIIEKVDGDAAYVILRCNGVNIGDRITDNKTERDDYRFHDVFHLGYAAILGWSPVTRALFRVKRKSNPTVDETQDGARAMLIEEGVSTWVFNHAARLNFFAAIPSLDYSLLKAIRELVSGYEVQTCPPWQWERAILEGYKVFRALRLHRKGIVTADLTTRSLSFQKLG